MITFQIRSRAPWKGFRQWFQECTLHTCLAEPYYAAFLLKPGEHFALGSLRPRHGPGFLDCPEGAEAFVQDLVILDEVSERVYLGGVGECVTRTTIHNESFRMGSTTIWIAWDELFPVTLLDIFPSSLGSLVPGDDEFLSARKCAREASRLDARLCQQWRDYVAQQSQPSVAQLSKSFSQDDLVDLKQRVFDLAQRHEAFIRSQKAAARAEQAALQRISGVVGEECLARLNMLVSSAGEAQVPIDEETSTARVYGPRIDTLPKCRQAVIEWLDKGTGKTRACNLAGVDFKTLDRYLVQVLENEQDLENRCRWRCTLEELGIQIE